MMKRYSNVFPPAFWINWPAAAAEPPVAMRSLQCQHQRPRLSAEMTDCQCQGIAEAGSARSQSLEIGGNPGRKTTGERYGGSRTSSVVFPTESPSGAPSLPAPPIPRGKISPTSYPCQLPFLSLSYCRLRKLGSHQQPYPELTRRRCTSVPAVPPQPASQTCPPRTLSRTLPSPPGQAVSRPCEQARTPLLAA